MKATQVILSAVLLSGLTAISFAGIGPQYWTQQGKNKTEQKTETNAPAKPTKEVKSCASCACCAATRKG